MSTATATATAADAAPAPAKGKKKLIIIVAAAVLVLALGGVGALLLLKKQAQAHDEDDWDDRDHHRKSGWSLFGKKRTQPQAPSYGGPSRTSSHHAEAPTRGATALQPAYEPEPESEDDLQIPSFLRRLAN